MNVERGLESLRTSQSHTDDSTFVQASDSWLIASIRSLIVPFTPVIPAARGSLLSTRTPIARVGSARRASLPPSLDRPSWPSPTLLSTMCYRPPAALFAPVVRTLTGRLNLQSTTEHARRMRSHAHTGSMPRHECSTRPSSGGCRRSGGPSGPMPPGNWAGSLPARA